VGKIFVVDGSTMLAPGRDGAFQIPRFQRMMAATIRLRRLAP
jgi:hypothetical protein